MVRLHASSATRPTNNLSAKDANGVPGREIVNPGDGDVLLPVPDHPGDDPAKARYMTMTTCHPKFTAEQRMIVHAVLDVEGRGRRRRVP